MGLPGPLTADQDKQLRTIQTSARHLLSLINDLLDLAKIESGKVELRLEPVDCQSMVQEVANALRPVAEGKGLALAVNAPDLGCVVQADRQVLSQIIVKPDRQCHQIHRMRAGGLGVGAAVGQRAEGDADQRR